MNVVGLHVFDAADVVGRNAGQLGRAVDRVFEEADLVDQAAVEGLLGGEDLAGGDRRRAPADRP